ncbi:hypothetical protein [Terrisporobacter sp.]|uniref:hypothetical protein n=1 Tax=Terrisporobacter sp. TaxID=1965305 RepID=UPI00261EC32F|nr:hypothetical protein [Terrisporobacter sp.]
MLIGSSIGVVASICIGVSEKFVGFIMLIPMSFFQPISPFVTQNYSSKNIIELKSPSSLFCRVIIFYIAFFHGNLLYRIFSKDEAVILVTCDYIKAYVVSC